MIARTVFLSLAGLIVCVGTTGHASEPLVVTPILSTSPLYNYEDAPATPDADDPAPSGSNREDRQRSLVIGTAKDAGLLVYDLAGQLIQAIRPPNAPHVSAIDPATPTGPNPATEPCPGSASGETFGRFNNVDIAYDVRLARITGLHASMSQSSPIADAIGSASTRSTRRIRPGRSSTSPRRTFREFFRCVMTSRRRCSQRKKKKAGGPNPVDDQNTVYGLTLAPGDEHPEIFVSERERGLVRQLRMFATDAGLLSYRLERTFLFDTNFRLKGEHGPRYGWTPCREAASEEPQSEGLVFDRANETLYVAFETIGLYKLPMSRPLPDLVRVGVDHLIEPVTSFGRPYRAVPDDDEFECEYDPEGIPAPGDIDAPGSHVNAGQFLAADLEGLSIIVSLPGQTLMLASSQGDSSFHFYRIGRRTHHAPRVVPC